MGVLFGDVYSDELGLIHKSTTIGEATPKIESIEIPGAFNALDLTEYFGTVLYNERTTLFTFYVIKSRNECIDKFTEIRNLLNGKRMDIVWSEDSSYIYNGRIKVTAYMDGVVGIIEVEAICNPYKLLQNKTVVSIDVSEELTVELANECMPTFPTITVDADMRIVFDGISLALSEGSYYATDIMLVQGINTIVCYGTGNITFEYQEGAL